MTTPTPILEARVQVDFNSLARDGQVRLTHRGLAASLTVGQTVLAEDSMEGMEYRATVADLDPSTGRIYLDMHWEPTNPELWAQSAR